MTSNNISSGRNSSWREASDWRVEFGNRWSYTPGTTNREVHWRATFRTGYRFRNILCPRVCLLLSSANNQSKETLRLGGRNCRHIFASLEVLVSLSRGRGNNGGIVSADSCATPSSSMVSPWSDNNSKKKKKNIKSTIPNGTLCDTSRSSSSQFPKLCPRSADFGGPIHARFGSALSPDETHASTVDTCCVGFAFPFTFESAVAHIIPRFGEDFLAISNFQTVHFSILAFHKFVMTGIVIAGPICSNFPYQRSRTTSVAVNDSGTLRQHLCVVWEQVLLCYQPFFMICWRIGEKYSESHIFGQLVSCALSVSLFKVLPDMENVATNHLFRRLSTRTRFAYYRPDIVQLPMRRTEQLVFVTVPDLVPVQINGSFPELLLEFLKLRSRSPCRAFRTSV